MAEKFLGRYFPPSRTAKLKNEIFSFKQVDGESLHETLERWKELLKKCPHHGLDLGIQIQSFDNRAPFGAKKLVYAFAGVSTNKKTLQEVYDLIEQITMNSYTWGGRRAKPKSVGVHNVDALPAVESRLATMIEQKMRIMNLTRQFTNKSSSSHVL